MAGRRHLQIEVAAEIQAGVRLRGASERRILMDLNYRDSHGEQAVRASVEDANKTCSPDELPPIQSMPIGQKAAPR